ncbi:hypothetical protein ACGF5S_31275 [Nocardia nova]|uniref:hypothetical protein n=1 Tax=Nocardia nova TaxID=37330 RepID=UPI00371C67C6
MGATVTTPAVRVADPDRAEPNPGTAIESIVHLRAVEVVSRSAQRTAPVSQVTV